MNKLLALTAIYTAVLLAAFAVWMKLEKPAVQINCDMYVSGRRGDDMGDGSRRHPKRTVRSAMNALPQWQGGTVCDLDDLGE